MRAPMARAVIGGLITSTLLTLLVVPVVYTLFDDFAAWIHRRWAKANALEQDAHGGGPGGRAGGRERPLVLLALLLPASARGASRDGAARRPARPDARRGRRHRRGEEPRRRRRRASYQDWVRGKYVEERAAALPNAHGSTRSCGALLGRELPGALRRLLSRRARTSRSADVEPLADALHLGARWARRSAPPRRASPPPRTSSTTTARRRSATSTAAFYDVLLARGARGDRAGDPRPARAAPRRGREPAAPRHGDRLRRPRRRASRVDNAAARGDPDGEPRPDRPRAAPARPRRGDARTLDVDGTLEAEVADPPPYEEVLADGARAAPRPRRRSSTGSGVYREFVKIQSADDKPRLDLRAGAGWKWLDAGGLTADGKTWNAGPLPLVSLLRRPRDAGDG